MANNEFTVNGIDVRFKKINKDDYISLTDLARYANPSEPKVPIATWMRNKDVISYLGLWERLHNPDFKGHEFETFESAAGRHSFYLSPQKWIESTNAIGIVSKSGNNGGTYAHRDIAFEFASWLSPEFKLYLVTEFQRLKAQEQKALEWSAKRELAKVNYRIHTLTYRVLKRCRARKPILKNSARISLRYFWIILFTAARLLTEEERGKK